MRRTVTRTVWLFSLLVVSAVWASACAPTFLYRHADRLVTWKVDDYFDLRSEQKQFVRTHVRDLVQQHRHEALPLYAAFLQEVKQRSADGVTPDEVEWAFRRYDELKRDLFVRVSPAAVTFLATISESQIRNIERVFQKEREKAQRILQASSEERIARRASDTVHWLTEWLGSLSPEQITHITAMTRQLPDVAPLRLQAREARQQRFVETLRTTREPRSLMISLGDLFLGEGDPGADARTMFDHAEQSVKELIVQIDRLLTPQQRTYALRKLQAMIDEISALTRA